MSFADELKQMEACADAIEWVGSRTETEAWAEFQRADWMLWLAARRPWGDFAQVVRAACVCGRTSLRCAGPKDQLALEKAYAAAEYWANNPTEENEKAVRKAHKTASTYADAAFKAAFVSYARKKQRLCCEAAAYACKSAVCTCEAATYEADHDAACGAAASAAAASYAGAISATSDAANASMADLIRPMFTPNSTVGKIEL